MIPAEDSRYTFYTTRSNYGGVLQRWILFQSESMHERYSIAEWKLRDRLKETCKTVPDQKGKPIVRPTMKWVFYLFRGVSEVVVKIGNKVNCEVANMKDVLLKILSLLGPECEKYYG